MNPSRTTSRPATNTAVLSVLAIVLALVTSACGSTASVKGSGQSAPKIQEKTSKRLSDMLPPEIQKRGYVVVATDASYPPMEFFATDNSTVIGLDPDLGQALGKLLGIDFRFTNVHFDGIIPGLTSGRFDLAMSDIIDKKKREAAVDFVTYLKAADGFLVAKGNPENVTDMASLCGKTMALQKGTNAVDVVSPQVQKCETTGKQKLTIDLYPSATAAKQAVAVGRAAAYMDDAVAMAYAAKTSPTTFQTIPGSYAAAPLGIALPKTSTQLRGAILAAFEEMISNGTYDAILKNWDSNNVNIGTPRINDAAY